MKKKNLLFLASLFTLGAIVSCSSNELTTKVYLLQREENNVVHLGDSIQVERRSLEFNGEIKEAIPHIITPYDNVISGDSFVANEIGLYRIVYKAYFGYEEVSQTVNYLCQLRSSDLFEINDKVTPSNGFYKYNTNKVTHSGAIFDVASGNKITYKNYIDVSSLNSNNPFIDLIVEPNQIGSSDMGTISLKLVDSIDEDNYVEILLFDSGIVDTYGEGTYMRAGFNGGIYAGREQYGSSYIWHYSSYGASAWSSFRALPNNNPTHDLKLYFDYNEKAFYASPALFNADSNSKTLVNDLDSKELYPASPWEGFKSNRAKLVISCSEISSGSGRLLIKSIGGVDLSPLKLDDTVAPTIEINYKEQNRLSIPKAVVGTPYKIFDATVSDNFDQDLKATYSVTYRDTINKVDIDVTNKDGYFIPTKEGNYTIRYNAKDRSGNVAETKIVRVASSNTIDTLISSLTSTNTTTQIFKEVAVPAVSMVKVVGGSGKAIIERTVYDPDGTEIEISNNSFIPNKVGEYIAFYEATDYIGQKSICSYTVEVTGLTEPTFVGDITLPKVLVKGFKYQLPNYETVETVDNQVKYLTPNIFVNGERYQNYFIASENDMTISYQANGETGSTSKNFVIPVIDGNEGKNQIPYFYGNFDVTENSDDITLSASSDASCLFATKLNRSDFSIYFQEIEGLNNYKYITFKLEDASNKNVSLTYKVSREGDDNVLLLPTGQEVAFAVRSGEMRLLYNEISKGIFDAGNIFVSSTKVDDKGNPFNGFKDGIYLTIGLEGVTSSSSIKLTKINNQMLGHKDEGEYVMDIGKPSIVYNSEFIIEQKENNDFFYPTFAAYDVLNDIVETTLKITSPSKKVLVEGDCSCTDTFKITEQGTYSIQYTATDAVGNVTKLIKSVYVYDETNPELTVKDMNKLEYKVGDSIAVPTYVASDNSGSVTVDVTVVLPDSQIRLLTHDVDGEITYYLVDRNIYSSSFIVDKTHFRAEQKGTYMLRYLAYDSLYNTVAKELKFIVK